MIEQLTDAEYDTIIECISDQHELIEKIQGSQIVLISNRLFFESISKRFLDQDTNVVMIADMIQNFLDNPTSDRLDDLLSYFDKYDPRDTFLNLLKEKTETMDSFGDYDNLHDEIIARRSE